MTIKNTEAIMLGCEHAQKEEGEYTMIIGKVKNSFKEVKIIRFYFNTNLFSSNYPNNMIQTLYFNLRRINHQTFIDKACFLFEI